MITFDIERRIIQTEPLMVLIEGAVLATLMEGSPGFREKTLDFSEILRCLSVEHPDVKFQFIPLTYYRWNGEEIALTSVLAIAQATP